jgi:gluconate 2-dehydrogenase alpha chain
MEGPRMTRKLPSTDVVIIGLGWTGSILAEQLTAEGLDVVAIERGPWRDTANDFPTTYDPDELRYASRLELFLRPAQETLTFRNTLQQTALPIRWFGSFLPGNGVGGAGVHWNGQTWRFLETDFLLRSHVTERYGAKSIPPDMTIQDWGVTYQELEPFYDQFEYIAGISGRAGNINGAKQQGGNPFEGPRTRDYPLPPLRDAYAPKLFADAAANLGYHPFPRPAANASQGYTNPLGVTMGACTFCGFCERFGCGNYSKGSPQTTILPVLTRRPNFTARTDCEVLRINKDSTGRKATGVTFVDTAGEEWEQPADLVLVCAFILDNARLMMLSGIGEQYDPATGKGVIGRNYAYQSASGARLFFEGKHFNPFIGTGSLAQSMDDFNGDNFDHADLGFLGGAGITLAQTHGRPIASTQIRAPGVPRWGAAWKKSVAETYQNTTSISGQGSVYSYRDAYLDLDPTYTDRFGRKLMRMTFDWHDNELKMTKYIADRSLEIGRTMGPKQIVANLMAPHYSVVPYQSTHNTGGVVMGDNPGTSAVNRYLQSWDVFNVFVIGASAFPQNAGYNPTGTVGALAYWAAHAIRSQYLKNPGPLVSA